MVFEFFTDPDNLLKVTPTDIPVEILNKSDPVITLGTLVELKMKLYGFVPVKWQTEITEWSPPDYFIDQQPKGPYRFWEHTHRFVEKNGGTLIIDHLRYAVPGYFLEPLIYRLFVKNSLDHIFDYRQQHYPEIFEE